MNDYGSKYWPSRASKRELESQMIANKTLAKMDLRLRETQEELIQQIEVFYARYARDNEMTLSEARKYLTAKELKDYKHSTLAKYRAMAKSGNPDYERILNAIGFRARISRNEALLMQIELKMLDLYGSTEGLVEYTYTGLSEVYKNSYYKTFYDLAMAGKVIEIASLTDATMQNVLSYNWSGTEFSKRIWGHEETTIQAIRNTLEKSFAAGHSVDRTARKLVEITDVAKSRAEALVRTESNFFHNLATNDSYNEAGIDKYEILATLDHRTSDICKEQDKEIYPTKDFNPGTNAPPFHVKCRSTTIPWFDEPEYMDGEKRQSADGLVDNMSYDEWLRGVKQDEQPSNTPQHKQAANVIPNLDNAQFIDQKLTKYALDKNHPTGGPKAVLFDDLLGYNQDNWELLKQNIMTNLPSAYATPKGHNGHGKSFESILNLQGPTGKFAYVLAGWIIKDGTSNPTLTTAYIIDEKKAKKKLEKGD